MEHISLDFYSKHKHIMSKNIFEYVVFKIIDASFRSLCVKLQLIICVEQLVSS